MSGGESHDHESQSKSLRRFFYILHWKAEQDVFVSVFIVKICSVRANHHKSSFHNHQNQHFNRNHYHHRLSLLGTKTC